MGDSQNQDRLKTLIQNAHDNYFSQHPDDTRWPGPEHPAKRFYRLRKTQGFQNVDRCYKESSNPQRAYKRNKEKHNAKYQRDMAQWLYYNQRKKAVDCVIREKNNKGCTIPLADLYQEFTSRWETPNNKCRPAL
ncbi:unnamed protein product, partial [Allacma fusca]